MCIEDALGYRVVVDGVFIVQVDARFAGWHRGGRWGEGGGEGHGFRGGARAGGKNEVEVLRDERVEGGELELGVGVLLPQLLDDLLPNWRLPKRVIIYWLNVPFHR